MKNLVQAMIYLTSCGLHNEVPDRNELKDADMEKLFNCCVNQSLSVIVCYALESAGINNDNFKKEKNRIIRNILLLDAERKNICSYYEENKIWYMPLKGVYLKNYYPKLGMRQMCDNDILIDPEKMDISNEYFINKGYKMHEGSGHDYSYLKLPCYNYEIHFALSAEKHGHNWTKYYENVKDKLVKDDNNNYGYHFTNEDFYLFMMMHEYKHFSLGGTGIRSLLDTYVFINKFNDVLDWDYIENECRKLEIAEYEKKARAVAMKLFSSTIFPELNEEEINFVNYFVNSGTYGTIGNVTAFRMERMPSKSKLRYVIRRIFPETEVYRVRYPFFYKHKILLPIAWLHRLFSAVFVSRKETSAEIKALKEYKK